MPIWDKLIRHLLQQHYLIQFPISRIEMYCIIFCFNTCYLSLQYDYDSGETIYSMMGYETVAIHTINLDTSSDDNDDDDDQEFTEFEIDSDADRENDARCGIIMTFVLVFFFVCLSDELGIQQ